MPTKTEQPKQVVAPPADIIGPALKSLDAAQGKDQITACLCMLQSIAMSLIGILAHLEKVGLIRQQNEEEAKTDEAYQKYLEGKQ